jgi:hypothetical protein
MLFVSLKTGLSGLFKKMLVLSNSRKNKLISHIRAFDTSVKSFIFLRQWSFSQAFDIGSKLLTVEK